MSRLISCVAPIAALAFLLACGGGESTGDKAMADKPAATAGGYKMTAVSDGGSIEGWVSFAGAAAPAKQKLEITKDVSVCGKEGHYSEAVVVSADQGLANVVVKITNISAGKGLDTLGEAVIDQQGCVFTPHVVVVGAGSQCAILNSDGILHNLHTYSEKNKPMNVAQPGFKKRMVQTFGEEEIIRIACDVHNWMGGYIVVADHPYYAVTDAEGNYMLADVPAGTYTLEFWQESLGTKTQEVTVTAGAASEANAEFGG